MIFVPPPGANNSLRLDRVIKRLRLASGCKLILDAADARSYASGQSWLDRSGGGYDFFLGTTGSSEGSDPALTGTPGTLGAYWAFDGGDWFTYDSANETWMNDLHKDNAIFTIAAWIYIGTAGDNYQIFGNENNSVLNVGLDWRVAITTNFLRFRVMNGTGSAACDFSGASAVPAGTWVFAALSLNEATGANGGAAYINASQELFTSTYTSPSAAAATLTMQIAARGNGGAALPAGSRMGAVMMWQGIALTAAQLTALYQATRRRFGV